MDSDGNDFYHISSSLTQRRLGSIVPTWHRLSGIYQFLRKKTIRNSSKKYNNRSRFGFYMFAILSAYYVGCWHSSFAQATILTWKLSNVYAPHVVARPIMSEIKKVLLFLYSSDEKLPSYSTLDRVPIFLSATALQFLFIYVALLTSYPRMLRW